MAKTKPFEEFTEEYDEWFEKNTDKYQAEIQVLKHFIPLKKNGLEVGVGSGRFAYSLNVKVGIDPSPEMLKKAKKLGIRAILGVAESLPIKSNCIDYVLMVTTICFVNDLQQTFREAFRILKLRGFIVLGFIDKESELGKTYLRNKEKSHFYSIANFFSTQEVLAYLTQAGFKNFEIKQTIFPENYKNQEPINGYGIGSFVAIRAQKV